MDVPQLQGSAASRHLVDGALVFWCTLWLVLGGLTGQAVWQLSELGETLRSSGGAIDDAGAALQSLGDLPVVGDPTARLGDEVRARAGEVVAGAAEAQRDVRRLAVLLGVTVALLPTVPVLALLLPARVRLQRQTRELRQALATDGGEAVEAYLAGRALSTLPLATLRRYTPTPLLDAHEGRHTALAEAELARLGLRRAASPAAPRSGSR